MYMRCQRLHHMKLSFLNIVTHNALGKFITSQITAVQYTDKLILTNILWCTVQSPGA